MEGELILLGLLSLEQPERDRARGLGLLSGEDLGRLLVGRIRSVHDARQVGGTDQLIPGLDDDVLVVAVVDELVQFVQLLVLDGVAAAE